MNLGIITFGCRLNSLESEAIASSFKKEGWTVHEGAEPTDDLLIINTCTVTSAADREARRIIRKYSNEIQTIVTGCYANLADTSEILSLGQKVQIVREKPKLLSWARDLKEGNSASKKADPFLFEPESFLFHSRAFLKIQDGCDNSCSYCAVHLARGGGISLDNKIVLERIKHLEDRGYKEICLTGVNLASYKYKDISFSKLLEFILPHLKDETRIRFSSIEPDYIDDLFFECIRDRHIFPFFHIPIQSASKKVLEEAGRKYDKEVLKNIIERIRSVREMPYIAADIIAGLPFEGEEEAEETYNFLKDMALSKLHVFPYSPRKNTKAAGQKRVPERIRDERAKKLLELSDELYANFVEKNKGREVEAIVEKVVSGGRVKVVTENYIKTETRGEFLQGDLVKISL